MAQMKAVQIHTFGDIDTLVYEDTMRPEAQAGEVLVRVRAAGVNQVDWKTRCGSGVTGFKGEQPFPYILGWDLSGEVVALGEGVIFSQAALTTPLPAGTTILLISSGAALGGSPLSGSYAGAKRMQMFLADYAQKESTRLHLGLQFLALAPGRIIPETELGKVAVEAYASSLDLSPADFIKTRAAKPTAEDVASAVVELASDLRERTGKTFVVSASGIELLS